jgi:hypothetical protein
MLEMTAVQDEESKQQKSSNKILPILPAGETKKESFQFFTQCSAAQDGGKKLFAYSGRYCFLN